MDQYEEANSKEEVRWSNLHPSTLKLILFKETATHSFVGGWDPHWAARPLTPTTIFLLAHLMEGTWFGVWWFMGLPHGQDWPSYRSWVQNPPASLYAMEFGIRVWVGSTEGGLRPPHLSFNMLCYSLEGWRAQWGNGRWAILILKFCYGKVGGTDRGYSLSAQNFYKCNIFWGPTAVARVMAHHHFF